MTQTQPPLGDHQLLAAYARENSDDAFRLLVDRHARWIFAAAFRQLGDRQLAEDATQTVFVLLAQRSRKMSANQKLSGWLFNTLRFTVRNFRRQSRRRQIHEGQAAAQHPTSSESPLRANDLAVHLDAAIANLPHSDRDVILLRYYQDRSFDEIAEALGITAVTARQRVSRGTKKLREHFDRMGVGKEPDAAALSAAAALGLDHAPPTLAQSAAHVALAAKAGAAIPTTILTATKGTAFLMAAAKIKILAVIALICFLVVPGTFVAVHYGPSLFAESPAPDSVTLSPAPPSAVEQVKKYDASEPWQVEKISSDRVGRLPPEVKILPTKFPHSSVALLVGYAPGSDKYVGIRASVGNILTVAYRWSAARMIFASPQPRDRYDFISTLPHGSLQALQAELKNKLGFVAHPETRDVDALLLKIKIPNAPGLKPPTTGGDNYFLEDNNHFRIYWENAPLSEAPELLEGFFNMPILDETGLTQHFSIDVRWKELPDRDPNHEALKKALLEKLGLALVPARAPVEMLIVKKIGS